MKKFVCLIKRLFGYMFSQRSELALSVLALLADPDCPRDLFQLSTSGLLRQSEGKGAVLNAGMLDNTKSEKLVFGCEK